MQQSAEVKYSTLGNINAKKEGGNAQLVVLVQHGEDVKYSTVGNFKYIVGNA